MFNSVNDKRLASLTLANIVACNDDVLNTARSAGSDVGSQKKYVNFDIILNLYSKINLENEDHCERVRQIVSAYSNGYITAITAGLQKPEKYATPIVIVSQVVTSPVNGTRKDIPTSASRFLNASIFKLLQMLNEDDRSTDELYISVSGYEKMLNSTLYQILDIYKNFGTKKIYPVISEFVKSLDFVDDLISSPMIQSLLKFYDIYVNNFDYKLVRDIIIDTCEYERNKFITENRKKMIGNFLPSILC